MKKTISVILISMLASAGFAQQVITRYSYASPVKVMEPIMNDENNIRGAAFSPEDLLDNTVRFSTDIRFTLITEDSGLLTLRRLGSGHYLYPISTVLRSDRFMTGTLKVETGQLHEVYVNGVKQDGKNDFRLKMDPQVDYEIRLKLLLKEDEGDDLTLKCEFVKDEGFEDAELAVLPSKKRIQLEQTAYTDRVSRVSLSNDGKYLLADIAYSSLKAGDRSERKLIDVKTGKVLMPSVRKGAAWLPYAPVLYYTVKGVEGYDLYHLDPATMEEKCVAQGLPSRSMTWAPDGSYFIYSVYEEGQPEKGPMKRVIVPDDRLYGNRNRSFLAKYDMKTGASQRLTFGYRSTYLSDLSADGSKMLYSTSRDNITGRPLSLTTLFEVDLNDLSVDTILYEKPFVNSAVYSPDENQILFLGSASAFDGVGMNCGNQPIPNDYDVQAFIMDRASGKIDPITRSFDPSVGLIEWNAKDGCIYFNADDGDCKHVYRYNPSKREFAMLPLERDVVSSFDIASENPSVAAYVGQDYYSIGVGYLYDAKRQTSRVFEYPMKKILNQYEYGKDSEWNFIASDGTEIKGHITLPPDFDAEKKYPMIVYYYGGTTPTVKGLANYYSAQLFASRGYVVYVIQPSGTIGYGQEFAARHANAWGKRTADDIIEGTKELCRTHPFVDAERIGCIGASYGGFMTQYLQTQTDIFAAAISHAGISNVTSYWGEGNWGYSYCSVASADSFPWNDPDQFTKQGSLFNADKINTPLLLLHGTVDTNVPIGESIQLFNALSILGKEVEFVMIEGEDHHVMDLEKREKWHQTIMAWFERWLKDRPEWWLDLYPETHYYEKK